MPTRQMVDGNAHFTIMAGTRELEELTARHYLQRTNRQLAQVIYF